MNQLRYDKANYIRVGVILLAVILLFTGGFVLLRIWEDGRSEYPVWDPEDSYVVYEGKEYEQKAHTEAFLVMGLDKFDGESAEDSYINDQQADFLMLFVFDNEAKTYTTIHINRDTMAPVHVLGVTGSRIDTISKQIALAHTYGDGRETSCRNTAASVSALLLGMRVRHYLSVKMDAVALYNDLLGGVEVEVLDDFSGIDDTLVKGERVTLKGTQALTYVRARYGMEDSSNIARMRRQRQYLTALQEKTEAHLASNDAFAADTILQLSEYLVSDSSVAELQELMNKVGEYEFTGIRTIDGESRAGAQFMEFHPDPASIEQLVIDVFYQLKD